MADAIGKVLATAICGQTQFMLGANVALNSALLIQEAGPAGHLTVTQRSWAISVTFAGALLGCVLAAALAPPLGARRLLLMLMPLAAAGSVAIYCGDGAFGWTVAGRLLVNTALGAGDGQARAYVAEVAAPAQRAVLSTAVGLLLFVGQLVGLALASVWRWPLQQLACTCAPAALGALGLLLLPDTAQWLMARGRDEKLAADALAFYRGQDFDTASEIDNIRASVEEAGAPLGRTWRALCRRSALRPLLLTAGQFFFFVWTGGFFLVVVTALVVGGLPLPLDDYQRAMLVPAVALLGTPPASPLLRRAGRLPLLRASGALSAVGCATIAAGDLMGAEHAARGWLALGGALVCLLPYSTLLTAITFNYLGELLPNSVRSLAVSLVMGWFGLLVFVSLQLYEPLLGAISVGGVFLVHAAVSLLQVLYASTLLLQRLTALPSSRFSSASSTLNLRRLPSSWKR
ncbi:Facilitated trehalose transporter Tret1-2 [Amphibalanus amphitrite]|uniref:Facilitated trehalose transporter Tret1-2 n=1 Tax=Amphibalanus amphitrite TaxID=1232801 RepID=A0A6A4V4Q0_AMPAM|nr:Facilitated trehalose transporter Tret1-2 [Amphibalanus amphitrite]KAF0310543.1 Facilitated trehalose transporter Tret1-2 [Amphibalanus amphitrite]